MRLTIGVPVAFLAIAAAQITGDRSEEHPAVGRIVKAPAGTFKGTASKLRPDVSAYLGIPFAKPPVGNLRFANPVKIDSLPGVFNATKFGNDCPCNKPPTSGRFTSPSGTKMLQSLSQTFAPMSEDCLTLNIWTKRQTGSRHKAVIIWVYGGGFTTGSSSISLYDGSVFADTEDVIFVSLNYRVNIFGFPAGPGVPPNPGFADVRLAVEWIRDNIAAFGGDNTRMVLQGQSAGAGTVDLYSYAYPKDPIVHGLIAESGSITVRLGNASQPRDTSWFKASAVLGCGDRSAGAASLACMRSKPTEAILKAILTSGGSATASGFSPTLDNTTIFTDYGERGSAGRFAKLPLLSGNNDHEEGFYELQALGANNGTIPSSRISALRAQGYGFTCGSMQQSAYRAKAGVPVWRYRYFGDFPNTRLYGNFAGVEKIPPIAAYHTAEIFTLFGTAEGVSGVPNTPAQTEVGDYMRAAWATFAKDPVNGLARQFDWPKYDNETQSLIRLAYNNETVASYVLPKTSDAICPAFFAARDSLSGRGVGL